MSKRFTEAEIQTTTVSKKPQNPKQREIKKKIMYQAKKDLTRLRKLFLKSLIKKL